jgi:hypothetical protein
MKPEVQAKMQKCLEKLGIPLNVAWTPNPGRDKHGEIELGSRTLFLYDTEESEAWQTFTHEICEYKFKGVCETYRNIINSLIEALEKVAYKHKEEFLDFIPEVLRLVEEEKNIEQE